MITELTLLKTLSPKLYYALITTVTILVLSIIFTCILALINNDKIHQTMAKIHEANEDIVVLYDEIQILKKMHKENNELLLKILENQNKENK